MWKSQYFFKEKLNAGLQKLFHLMLLLLKKYSLVDVQKLILHLHAAQNTIICTIPIMR
jgi:hypothetical protein